MNGEKFMQDNKLQREVTQKIAMAGIFGLIAWTILMLRASGTARDAALGTTTNVTFGPLVLAHISKQAVDGGSFSVGMTLDKGLAVFLLAFLLLGALAGYLIASGRLRRGSRAA
jgi:hypothetical protein